MYKQALILPCPFCGHKIDLEDIHRNGILWRDDPEVGRVYYLGKRTATAEGECWVIRCYSPHCGVELSADSEEEVIERWNTRTPSTT